MCVRVDTLVPRQESLALLLMTCATTMGNHTFVFSVVQPLSAVQTHNLKSRRIFLPAYNLICAKFCIFFTTFMSIRKPIAVRDHIVAPNMGFDSFTSTDVNLSLQYRHAQAFFYFINKLLVCLLLVMQVMMRKKKKSLPRNLYNGLYGS